MVFKRISLFKIILTVIGYKKWEFIAHLINYKYIINYCIYNLIVLYKIIQMF